MKISSVPQNSLNHVIFWSQLVETINPFNSIVENNVNLSAGPPLRNGIFLRSKPCFEERCCSWEVNKSLLSVTNCVRAIFFARAHSVCFKFIGSRCFQNNSEIRGRGGQRRNGIDIGILSSIIIMMMIMLQLLLMMMMMVMMTMLGGIVLSKIIRLRIRTPPPP